MRAGAGAGCHQFGTITGVGTDGRADHPGALDHPSQRRGIAAVGHHKRQRGAPVLVLQRRLQRLQLVGAAASQGPAQLVPGAISLGHVLGDKLAGEASGAPDDYVEFPLLLAHALNPSGDWRNQ